MHTHSDIESIQAKLNASAHAIEDIAASLDALLEQADVLPASCLSRELASGIAAVRFDLLDDASETLHALASMDDTAAEGRIIAAHRCAEALAQTA